jgi:hypothetical protein
LLHGFNRCWATCRTESGLQLCLEQEFVNGKLSFVAFAVSGAGRQVPCRSCDSVRWPVLALSPLTYRFFEPNHAKEHVLPSTPSDNIYLHSAHSFRLTSPIALSHLWWFRTNPGPNIHSSFSVALPLYSTFGIIMFAGTSLQLCKKEDVIYIGRKPVVLLNQDVIY